MGLGACPATSCGTTWPTHVTTGTQGLGREGGLQHTQMALSLDTSPQVLWLERAPRLSHTSQDEEQIAHEESREGELDRLRPWCLGRGRVLCKNREEDIGLPCGDSGTRCHSPSPGPTGQGPARGSWPQGLDRPCRTTLQLRSHSHGQSSGVEARGQVESWHGLERPGPQAPQEAGGVGLVTAPAPSLEFRRRPFPDHTATAEDR